MTAADTYVCVLLVSSNLRLQPVVLIALAKVIL